MFLLLLLLLLLLSYLHDDDTMKIIDTGIEYFLCTWHSIWNTSLKKSLMLIAILYRRYHSSPIFTNEEAETPCPMPHPSPMAD